MCELCDAKTQGYTGPNGENILPGYHLVKATQNGFLMKAGDWGLVRSNDPDFWWTGNPIADPWFGLTNEEICNAYDDSSYDEYESAVNIIEEALCGNGKNRSPLHTSFDVAIYIYEAGKAAGYDRDVHGYFAFWLCHHLAKFIETAKVTS